VLRVNGFLRKAAGVEPVQGIDNTQVADFTKGQKLRPVALLSVDRMSASWAVKMGLNGSLEHGQPLLERSVIFLAVQLIGDIPSVARNQQPKWEPG
jgi:hypothetical protein